MRQILFLLLFVYVSCALATAQNRYYVAKQAGKFGIIDSTQKDRFIIPPVFSQIYEPTPTGEVGAKLNSLWGIINLKQDTLLPFIYEDLRYLQNQCWAFKQHTYWGVVRLPTKNTFIPNKYLEIKSFEVMERRQGWLVRGKEGWGFLDTLGNELASPLYERFERVGNIIVMEKAGKWGIAMGQKTISPTYDQILYFSNRYLMVCRGLQYGLFDLTAWREVVRTQFSDIRIVGISTKNYFLCYDNQKVGIANANGVFLPASSYDDIQYDEEGDIFSLRTNNIFGFASPRTGKVIAPQYGYIGKFRGKVALVEKNGLFGVVNVHGEEVIAPQYTKIVLSSNSARLYLAGRQELVTFDEEGRVIAQTSPAKVRTIRIIKANSLESVVADSTIQRTSILPVLPAPRRVWFQHGALWGLRNAVSNATLISPTYDSISTNFPAKVTLVYKGKNVGLVYDSLGIILLKPQNKYEVESIVRDFQTQEIARLRKKGDSLYTGYLMKQTGKMIFDVNLESFREIEPFREGFSKFSVGDYPRMYGIMGREGNIVLYPIYTNIEIIRTQGSSVFFLLTKTSAKKKGYARIEGTLTTDLQYLDVKPFTFEFGAVALRGNYIQKNNIRLKRWGLVNATGKEVVPIRYKDIIILEQNRFLIKEFEEKRYFLTDTTLQPLLREMFVAGVPFKNGVSIVQKNARVGLLNYDAQWILKPRYHKIEPFNDYGWTKAYTNKQRFVVSTDKGTRLLPHTFKRSRPFNEHNLALFTLKNGRLAWLDRQGKILGNMLWEEVRPFHEGISVVRLKHKWGAIDAQGNWVLTPQFDRLTPFFKGYARASTQENGKKTTFFIDTKGNRYDSLPAVLGWRMGALRFSAHHVVALPKTSPYSVVHELGRVGLQNSTGAWAIPPYFDGISLPYEEQSIVYIKQYMGLADANGRILLPCQYWRILPIDRASFRVEQGTKLGYYNAHTNQWEWQVR